MTSQIKRGRPLAEIPEPNSQPAQPDTSETQVRKRLRASLSTLQKGRQTSSEWHKKQSHSDDETLVEAVFATKNIERRSDDSSDEEYVLSMGSAKPARIDNKLHTDNQLLTDGGELHAAMTRLLEAFEHLRRSQAQHRAAITHMKAALAKHEAEMS